MVARWLLMVAVLVPHLLIAQKQKEHAAADSGKVYTVSPVQVQQQKDSMALSTYHMPVVQEAGINPVLAALQGIPGLQVRDYGGIGGLKAVSLRGLGAEHTQTLLNGMPVGQNSMAYTDYGLLPTALVTEVRTQTSAPTAATALMMLGGPQVQLTAALAHHPRLTATMAGGSFGWFSPNITLRHGLGNHTLLGHAQYQNAHGAYDYSLPNGTEQYSGRRNNAGISQTQAWLAWQYERAGRNPNVIRNMYYAHGHLTQSDRQLPGAVVLYNPYSSQFLSVTQMSAAMKTQQQRTGGWYWGKQSDYQSDRTLYLDPGYHNASGGLRSDYHWHQGSSSIYAGRKLRNLNWHLAGDYQIQNLGMGAPASVGKPVRQVGAAAGQLNYLLTSNSIRFNSTASAGYTLVLEHPQNSSYGLAAYTLGQEVQYQSGKHNLSGAVHYRRHNRLATFAELYYGQAWPRTLKPEQVHQLNFTGQYRYQSMGTTLEVQGQAYWQQVQDKIVALPTRDLFVWSIMNVGQVQGRGLEAQLSWREEWGGKLYTKVQSQFTYQHLQDVSTEGSASFGGQLPYVPFYTQSSQLTMGMGALQLGMAQQFTSLRYTLAENTAANRMPGFMLFDAFGSYTLPLSGGQSLGLGAGVYNLLDTPYEVLLSFPMPGRNFKLTLTYVWQ